MDIEAGHQVPLPHDLPIIERSAVGIVVLDAADKLLLFHTHDLDHPDLGTWWELPGGGIDPGETYLDAAIRELREEVLEFGFDHASRHHLALHAVLCWPPDLLASMSWRHEPPPPARAEAWLAETLAGWRERYPDVTVHRGVVRGHPVAGLVASSAAQYLLVVGSRGRHALAGTLLGSVSQGVLHHATCPVAVVSTHAR